MIESLFQQLQNANTQWVLVGTILLSLASGVVGSFTLLRRQSLIGDAMAHAALPGVCIAYLLYGEKSLLWFLVGAALAALLSSFIIQFVIQHSRIKEDSALGIIISVFFGLGIVLLTYIQHNGAGNQSGLDDFIFGKAASMVAGDVQLITIIAIIVLVLIVIFYKEFKLLTFDPQFAKGLGFPTKFLNGLLLMLIVCSVVIGLQTVGVVLMAAMLITPAISARYWTNTLSHMIMISGVIGGFSGVLGTLLSTIMNGMATGPLIIVASTCMFLFSLIFAPKRGLLAKAMKQISIRKRTAVEHVLISFYELAEKGGYDGVEVQALQSKRKISIKLLNYALNFLQKKGYIQRECEEKWSLSNEGIKAAYNIVINQRLYEMYLMYEMDFAQLELKNKDDLQLHLMSNEVKGKLLSLLKLHDRTPLLLPESSSIDEGRKIHDL